MYRQVIAFWFEETPPARWWKSDDAFDDLIRQRFGEWHGRAARGELFRWREHPLGRLAEVILLDQFSRNMYRGTARAFEQDVLALVLAQEAVARGVDQSLSAVERSFLYMPYMHSESPLIHRLAVDLFRDTGIRKNLEEELRHKAIIHRFGRYPHRNEILGRLSTEEEVEFLRQPGSRF